MSKFFLTFAVFIFFVGVLTGVAQDKPVLETSPPPPAARRSVIKTVGNAKVFYIDSKEEGVATSGSISLFRTGDDWGTISLSFPFKGKTVQKPTTVMISIFIATKDRTYVDDRKLVIQTNGKELFDGVSDLSDGRTNGIQIYSSLRLSLSLQDFTKIAKAKRATVRVGPTTFEISSVGLSTFRDLLTIIDEES